MICLPIFMTGLSDVIGSWNTTATSWPQICCSWRFGAWRRSAPLNRTRPVGVSVFFRGSSPMIDRDSTVLPEPDSPTMPRVRPPSSVNVTPSTARTSPRDDLKYVRTSSTTSNGSSVVAAAPMIAVLTARPP